VPSQALEESAFLFKAVRHYLSSVIGSTVLEHIIAELEVMALAKN